MHSIAAVTDSSTDSGDATKQIGRHTPVTPDTIDRKVSQEEINEVCYVTRYVIFARNIKYQIRWQSSQFGVGRSINCPSVEFV
jgi:hypothetical protein